MVLAFLAAACGPPKGIAPGTVPAPGTPVALPPRPLAEVFVLEASGVQPEDTALVVPAGAARVVVMRRSAPDFGIFAKLLFPAQALTAPAGATEVSLTLRPRPSLYALDLEVVGAVGEGATIVFSYGAHFLAPAGARERYGSNLAFEKELAIGRLSDSGQVVFLPTSHPASDIVSAPLAGPGRYLVAAPR
ncbi:MAG TPA: hypothetical protein VFU23_10900 [Gemmatimonadales bacterium]|nr:hypothetical protein [Gemmatimonadales bacterium]